MSENSHFGDTYAVVFQRYLLTLIVDFVMELYSLLCRCRVDVDGNNAPLGRFDK